MNFYLITYVWNAYAENGSQKDQLIDSQNSANI